VRGSGNGEKLGEKVFGRRARAQRRNERVGVAAQVRGQEESPPHRPRRVPKCRARRKKRQQLTRTTTATTTATATATATGGNNNNNSDNNNSNSNNSNSNNNKTTTTNATTTPQTRITTTSQNMRRKTFNPLPSRRLEAAKQL
jgi:hypothetical protein